MRFTEYLVETYILTESGELVFQKIIDHVDLGHVDYSEDKIVINVGRLVKDSKLSNLQLVIRKGSENSVELGQHRDTEKYAIVVTRAGKLPQRMNIDKFLSTNKEVMTGFEKAYKKYIKDHYEDSDAEPSEYEKRASVNNRGSFEGKYNELLSAIKNHLDEYNAAKHELEQNLEKTVSHGHKHSINLAIEKLKQDYVGKNAKEFKGKALKLPEADFVGLLDKDLSAKVHSRLENYYESLS